MAFALQPAPVAATLCAGNGEYVELGNEDTNHPQCHTSMVCQQPEIVSVEYELANPFCDPMAETCAVQARVTTRFPGNHQNDPSGTGFVYSFATLRVWRPDGTLFDACGVAGATIQQDKGAYTVSMGVSCLGAELDPTAFQLDAEAVMCPCSPGTFCPWGACEKKATERLDFANNPAVQCVPKAPNRCEASSGSGGCSGNRATGALSCALASPGASFTYRSGGVGNANLPGTAAWRPTLGRNLAHDYAERLVQDPQRAERVWLMTREGVFREFRDMQGDGVYEYAAPSDEKRTLRRAAAGWTLTELDGTVHTFDASGLWLSALDPHGVGKRATYSGGVLARVDMPDGQHELFGYHPDGKLATVTKVGVDGTTSRVWRYTWSGHDLVRVDLPSGEAQRLLYEDPRHPGFLTQLLHVGTDGSVRVETAAEYDAAGRVVRIWRGSVASGANGPVPGPDAVDLWSHRFVAVDAAGRVTRTEVIDPLGGVSVHEFSRDPRSETPRLLSTSGDCPACGLGPNSRMVYGDPANPLRPTQVIDARGTPTLYTYDANGLPLTRTEAAGTSLARTTRWEYDGPFPALITAVEQPSTSGSGVRRTVFTYDAEGSLETETHQGFEAGAAFALTTTSRYNAAGQLEESDPPGYGTADVSRMSYDPARGDLVPLSRTDPLVGATRFGYDAWNRRTSVTDPNGVRTVTTYDLMDRVVEITQEGATAADNLTTRQEYNAFGDLVRTILPAGNVVEFGYDSAGRMISLERKPDRLTPGERTLFTLDAYGHRVREEHQRWDGSGWVSDAVTSYQYSTRCQLDKIFHPDGSVTEHAYDCNGNLEKVWDGNHPSNNRLNPASVTYGYDLLDRLTSTTQPWAGGGNAVTSYLYDVQDHLLRVTDAEGNVTRYTYSDRDLMTEQVSEVSGTTTYRYNEHGELVSETDARGVTVTRTLDALDRVTFVDYPEAKLDTAYTYDDPLLLFSKGRLTAILRDGLSHAYRYDRFGRMLQDGALTFAYDANGNRREIGYPGGVTAAYTFDFADREQRLVVTEPGQSPRTFASDGLYLASGPLTSLALGNGLTEIRSHDARFFPTEIRVPGKLDWRYTTDGVGNILEIADGLDPAATRTYGYQDHAYFLTRGDGPWGTRAWTYDKIGNRLSETRNGARDTYTYPKNAAGGNNPRLSAVTPPSPAPASIYTFDPAGNQIYRTTGGEKLRFDYSGEKQISQMSTDRAGEAPALSKLGYDGRGFLNVAAYYPNTQPDHQIRTVATYSSAGLLYHKVTESRPAPLTARDETLDFTDSYLFYFAGRPLAHLDLTATGGTTTRRLRYLTTDHLGTPVLATEETGNVAWAGGFEPFGADWNGAEAAGVFLRFPGQWEDGSWGDSGLYHNLHRWFAPTSSRYDKVDPLRNLSLSLFIYADSNPLTWTDRYGLLPADYTSEQACLICMVFGEGGIKNKACQRGIATAIWNRVALHRGTGRECKICDMVMNKGQFNAYDEENWRLCQRCTEEDMPPRVREVINNLEGLLEDPGMEESLTPIYFWANDTADMRLQRQNEGYQEVKINGCAGMIFHTTSAATVRPRNDPFVPLKPQIPCG